MDGALVLLFPGVSRLLIGSFLAYAGYTKLRDVRAAQIGLLDYQLLPARLAAPAAILVGAVEVSLGVFVGLGIAAAAAVAVLFLAGLSGVAASALLRGLEIDCHCAGNGERLTVGTLVRNASLMVTLAAGLLLSDDVRLLLWTASLPQAASVALGVAAVSLFVAMQRAWAVGASLRGSR